MTEAVKVVQKVLDLSTGHLPRATVERIDAGSFPRQPYMSCEYGFLYTVPEAVELEEVVQAWDCEAYKNVLRLASSLGCDFVLFDRDAEPLDELPLFDW